MEVLAFGVGTLIYKTLLDQATTNLYETVKTTLIHPQVKAVLEELDIESTLEIISSVVKELPDYSSEAVTKCIKSVEDCITKIEDILKEIHVAMLEHQQKYFANWRTPAVDQNISRLRLQKKILSERIDLLIKVLAINKERKEPPSIVATEVTNTL